MSHTAFDPSIPRSADLLATLIPYFGCLIQPTTDGIQLTGAGSHHMNAAAITPRTFRAPFTLRTVAKTDSTNLRLYWHVGEIILRQHSRRARVERDRPVRKDAE
jgi:hypothetical protein